MWRCYDMTEGQLQLDGGSQPEVVAPAQDDRSVAQVDWPLPRLITVAEASVDYRLIRIPPGFISC